MDGPGQGTRPVGEKGPRPVPATDEIYEKYLQKAIVESNELAHEIALAGGNRVPVVGSDPHTARKRPGLPAAVLKAIMPPKL